MPTLGQSSDNNDDGGASSCALKSSLATALASVIMLVMADLTAIHELRPDDALVVLWVVASVLVIAVVFTMVVIRLHDVMVNGVGVLDESATPWHFMWSLLDSVISLVLATALCATGVLIASERGSQIDVGQAHDPRGMPGTAIFPVIRAWSHLLLHTMAVTVGSMPGEMHLIGIWGVILYTFNGIACAAAFSTFWINVIMRVALVSDRSVGLGAGGYQESRGNFDL
jgi:hypothetical protein